MDEWTNGRISKSVEWGIDGRPGTGETVSPQMEQRVTVDANTHYINAHRSDGFGIAVGGRWNANWHSVWRGGQAEERRADGRPPLR